MKVGILGAGWLGSVLAEKALKNNHTVKVSGTSPKKVSFLKDKGFNAQLLNVMEDRVSGDLSFFRDIDTLIITIPPGLRKNPTRNYVGMIEQLIEKIVRFEIKKVVYTSSTSVYGFEELTITEESEILPITNAGKQIAACEKKLLDNTAFESCIIRLGGLMGPDRHPIYSLSGKQNLPNPKSPINFIHQKDAVGIILHLTENWKGNDVYNAVAPYHPPREKYYNNISKLAKVPPPTFQKKGQIRGEISSLKLLKSTSYDFSVENLLKLN